MIISVMFRNMGIIHMFHRFLEQQIRLSCCLLKIARRGRMWQRVYQYFPWAWLEMCKSCIHCSLCLVSPSFNKFPFLSFNFNCVLKLKFLAYRGWPSNSKKSPRLYHSFFLSVIPLKFS